MASLHEYFVLLFYANEYDDFVAHLILRNIVEYSFGNHRAFYDLLHRIVCDVHKEYVDKASSLKDSFEPYTIKSEDDLREKFLFPQPIVDFYKSREEPFLTLRYTLLSAKLRVA